ncbi:MAG: rhomboid family intramembrane serine protease, partial [Candidatus Aenigmarchaeota archaeon]|nr:rhomboid family intramembrane serine protease [Candidatus Aenigmarchaeota archaeon]
MKYYALILCAFIFVVFILQIAIPGFTNIFVLSGAERPWTFITSIFLHDDITHLLSNLFALGFF